MKKRAVVVMKHSPKEQPVKEMAQTWGVSCNSLKRTPLAWPLQWAILLIDRDFYDNFMHLYELEFEEETAPEFMLNLRLLHSEGLIIALWFSDELAENVIAWQNASEAIEVILGAAEQAKEPQKHLASLKDPFNVKCKTARMDVENYIKMLNDDLSAITNAAKCELRSCLL